MSKKFLDSAGVQHLYSKIDSKMETFAQTIEETFVPETRMIAGIDLSKDISAENLKTQLNIGAGDSVLVGTENPTVIGLTASENQLYLQTQNIDLVDPAAILYIYTKDASGNLIWLPLTEKFATVHRGYQTDTPPRYATAHSMKIGDFYHLPSKPALYILISADFTDEEQDEIECIWQEVALDQNVAAKTLKLSAAPTTTTNGSTGQLAYVVEYDGTKYSAPTYVCAAETNASGLTSWVSTMPDSDTLLHFLNKNNVVFEETGEVVNIEFDNNYISATENGQPNSYVVKNGICYGTLDFTSVTDLNGQVVINTTKLPPPLIHFCFPSIPYGTEAYTKNGILIIGGNDMVAVGFKKDCRYLFSFSYPVA